MGKIEVIAEIGKNFVCTKEPQPLELLLLNAKALIRAAKEAGADICKFQVHNYEDEVHPEAKIISPHFDHDRYEWVKRNTYPVEFWREIKDYCHEVGIEFLATPMSRGAAELLDEVGVDRWKIGSGDVTDFVLLDYVRQSGKPVILSSGMSTIQELRKAYNYLREKGSEVSIMHCVSIYPCPLDRLNLSTITFLKKEFPEAKIGFSDHSTFTSTGRMAVQLGAEIIEKHFTLDKDAWGPDHKVSLLPSEFSQMVEEIQSYLAMKRGENNHQIFYLAKDALGVETKFIDEQEMPFRKKFRKGLYAGCDVKAGELWHNDLIYALRPRGEALSAETYPDLLGTISVKDYKKYEAIK